MSIARLIFVSLFLLSFAAFSAQDLTQEKGDSSALPATAGYCLVVDDQNNVLMIDEAISGRYAIPGGSMRDDEIAADAAQRELFEKTGLKAWVGEHIADNGSSAIFACTLASPAPYFIDATGRKVLMAWKGAHFGREVKRVLMLPVTHDVQDIYRLPEHKEMLAQWLTEVSPSEFVLSQKDSSLLTPFYQQQLAILQEINQTHSQSRVVASLAAATVAVGSIFSPLFFLLTLLFVRAYYGHRSALIYSVGLITSAVFTLVLSTVIELPRPFFIDPVFGESNTFGYTLPSIPVALTTYFFAWALMSWDKEKQPKGRKRLMLAAAVSVLAISGKVLLQGEHYPTDVASGLLIGLGAGVAFCRLREWRLANRNLALISARFWLLLFAVVVIIGAGLQKPHILYLSAFCFGVYCALLWLKVFPLHVSPARRPSKWGFFAIAIVGVLAILYADQYLASRSSVNAEIVALNSLAAWGIAVWLLVITPSLLQRLNRR